MTTFASGGSALSVGYTVLDVIVHADGVGHSAGGTASNVAANLAHLGWTSSLTALCGDDPAGSHLRADLAKAGVNVDGVRVSSDLTTPTVIHEVLPRAHRFRFGCPLCGRKLPRFQPVGVAIGVETVERVAPDVLVVDRVSKAAVEMARITAARGGLVVFEPSRPAENGRFAELVRLSHLLKFSDDQIKPRDLSSMPCGSDQVQVRTLGARGAEWRRAGGPWQHVDGFQAAVLDAAGAGDWTTAALLAALGPTGPVELASIDLGEPLRVAQAVAALSCEFVGARGLSRSATLQEITDAVSYSSRLNETVGDHRPKLVRSRRRANCATCLAP